MAKPKTPENHLKHLEKQIAEATNLLDCIVMMEFIEDLPTALKARIFQFLGYKEVKESKDEPK